MKKILVVLMAMLTMAVMLTGCGGDSKKAAYPADGDISVIIPKAPGGGTDISARGLIQFMEKRAEGQQICSRKQTRWRRCNRHGRAG